MTGFRKFGSAAALVMISGAAMGQVTSGNIAGVVKDATGAVVPNAAVSVKSESTGVVVNIKTNGAGEYLVQNLLPAAYDISVVATGFANSSLKAVPVTLNATTTADVSINTGSTSTEVEVTAASVVLDTTTTNLTTSFESQELSTLPITAVGLGVINASLLSPGVASTGGLGIGVGPSIGGQRPRNNNFMIEGIDNNNKAVTGPLVYVPNDAVGDFTLITNQFSPEFGHSSGGQFNTNVVSGTNKFHGKIYEYFQNRNLNAASGIAGGKIPNPRFDNNRYGGQLGGPVLRNKLFFFANFERNTIFQNASYYLCTPTAAGISALGGLGTYGLSANNLAQFQQYVTPANITGAGGAGIDAAQDNACAAQKAGPQYTTVTNAAGTAATQIPLGNLLVNAGIPSIQDDLTTAADYTISPSDSFRARYIYNTIGGTDNAANTVLPIFYTPEPFKYHLIALSEYHNFTPNLTNEVRIGFNRYQNDLTAGNFNYPGLDVFPNLTFFDMGGINVGPDGNAPQFTVQNLYQITDNISWVRGRHTIKIGFDGRKYISPQGFTQRARGDYEYNSINVFLHDLSPDSFGERSTGSQTYYGDQTALYGYVNDTWRASDKLTFNAGLRYEFTSVPVGERAQALNSVASVPGLIDFHAPQPGYTNIFPRVGINYAPDTKTSIRLGYGLAGDVLFDNLGTLSFPPQYSTTQDVDITKSTPNFLAGGGLPPGTGSGTVVLTPTEARAATSAYLPDQVVPYSENYTLTIQRTIGKGLTAEVGYIGTRGIHLPTQIQYNIQPRVNTTNNLFTTAGATTLQASGTNATNLADISALSNILPQFLAAGFTSKITSYQPYSSSNYNGLIANLTGRVHDVQLNFSYTFSKAMDNATDEVFATVLTPRRPQDSQNLNADYSRSALDRTHRVTLEADYNFLPFKGGNFLMKNVVGNWTVAPIYTYESPEYATVLSGVNSNLNGDSGTAIDRSIINPSGVKGTGSGVNPVLDAGGNTVGYTAIDPTAYYIQAGAGTLPTSSRNTLPIRPINNLDASVFKRFTAFDHYSVEFGAQAFNVLNHAQYQPGTIDNVNGPSYTASYNYQTVTSAFFNRPDKEFLNQARTMQLSAKFLF